MNFKDLLGRIIVAVFFLIVGIALLILALRFLGVIKFPEINSKKWTKTKAKITGSKMIAAKTIGKNSSEYEQFVETAIVYKVNNTEYRKCVRCLLGNHSHIYIYYKNKNPNYFKLQSEVKNIVNIQKPLGFFLCFLSLCMLIYSCMIAFSIYFKE